MKANEVRFGNWLYGTDGKPNRVNIDAIQYLVAYGETSLCQVTPIPITEDILLKCGFEVLESSSCKEFHIGINEVTKDWLFSLVWLIKPELINAPNTPFYRNGGHHIAYVHQLQNLYFALTGHELTYTP